MPSTFHLPSRRRCLVALTALLVISPAVEAQAPAPKLRSVVFFDVKPDRSGDLRSAIKDYVAVLKKANYKGAGTWWSSQAGPAQMALVQYHEKWSELDEEMSPELKEHAAQLTAIRARFNQCVNGMRRVVSELLPDHSMPMGQDVPKLARVTRLQVSPEHVADYLAFHKATTLPAMTKAGVKEYGLSRTRYGGSVYEYWAVSSIGGWGDLDKPAPIIGGLGGEDAYQKYLAKVRPMMEDVEYNVYRHESDLSYIPSPR